MPNGNEQELANLMEQVFAALCQGATTLQRSGYPAGANQGLRNQSSKVDILHGATLKCDTEIGRIHWYGNNYPILNVQLASDQMFLMITPFNIDGCTERTIDITATTLEEVKKAIQDFTDSVISHGSKPQ